MFKEKKAKKNEKVTMIIYFDERWDEKRRKNIGRKSIKEFSMYKEKMREILKREWKKYIDKGG